MKIDLLGVKIDNLTKPQVLKEIDNRLTDGGPIFIVTPYSESIVAAQKDAEFRKVLNAADFALPDGIGILWAAKFLESRIENKELRIWALLKTLAAIVFNPTYIRSPIPEKISGSDFVWDLAELAAKNNYSTFLLGGFGDTAERVGERLREKFTNLKIAGTSNVSPPPTLPHQGGGKKQGTSLPSMGREGEGWNSIIETINSFGADFLFVALGPIRQEKWIYENLPKLRVKLAIGLGGTFDYIAGKRPSAPQIWRSAGLEWLWRLFTQPSRIIRIFKGVVGLIIVTIRSK